MASDLHVGFTGSSEHITEAQRFSVARIFRELRADRAGETVTLHHGDCIVGDAMAHVLAKLAGWRIEIHPPSNSAKRAFCPDADVVHQPRDYMDRNTDIARACSVLVAAPDEADEITFSGTWSTVRRGRHAGCRILIVCPDGTIREELGQPRLI